MISKIWAAIRWWLWGGSESAAAPQVKSSTKKSKAVDVGVSAVDFKKDVLDRLDSYFKVLRRMKSCDPEAYEMYSQLGGMLPIRNDKISMSVLSPWFNSVRPGFGAVFLTTASEAVFKDDDGKDKVTFRFCYFTKYLKGKEPSEFQKLAGGHDVYSVVAYWDDEKKERYPSEFGVAIDRDGNIRVLKVRRYIQKTIKGRRGDFAIPKTEWGYDPFFTSWANEHKCSVDELLKEIFIYCANSYEVAHYRPARVDVRNRGGLHAAFCIDPTGTAQVFRDRSVTLNERGRKRKIFHSVRPHQRGLKSFVRLHFRGEREFMWRGYFVRITVPGIHHTALTDFDFGAASHNLKDPIPRGTISMGEMAKEIRKLALDRDAKAA